MKNIRLKRKVESLEGVVKELKRRNLVSEECASILENTYAGVPKEIMKRIVLQKKKKNPGAYPSELRSFALTLKYYSSKAYRFVRKSFNLGLPSPQAIDHDYCDISNIVMVSEYKEAVISYIAGFVAKKAVKKIACPSCVDALTTNNLSAFVTWKSNGGLAIPSESLVRVCTETEKCIMRMINATGGSLPNCSNLHGAIATVVLAQCIDANVFKSLESHMYDTTATNNHIARIIKTCAQIYTNIRMKHQGKRFTDNITGKKVRKQLSKLILFKNQ